MSKAPFGVSFGFPSGSEKTLCGAQFEGFQTRTAPRLTNSQAHCAPSASLKVIGECRNVLPVTFRDARTSPLEAFNEATALSPSAMESGQCAAAPPAAVSKDGLAFRGLPRWEVSASWPHKSQPQSLRPQSIQACVASTRVRAGLSSAFRRVGRFQKQRKQEGIPKGANSYGNYPIH